MPYLHPTGSIPRRVVILAAGPSKQDWVNACASMGIDGGMPDEVWSLNTIPKGIPSSVCFIMDDYYAFKGHHPQFEQWMRECPIPVITSRVHKEIPNATAYPLDEVLKLTGARAFLNHTAAYMIAYGIVLGVKEMMIFGADYIDNSAPYVTGAEGQKGCARFLGCASYWLGMAAARGISVAVTPSSPLLDADIHSDNWFYGYWPKPVVKYYVGQPKSDEDDATAPPVEVKPPLRAVQG